MIYNRLIPVVVTPLVSGVASDPAGVVVAGAAAGTMLVDKNKVCIG